MALSMPNAEFHIDTPFSYREVDALEGRSL